MGSGGVEGGSVDRPELAGEVINVDVRPNIQTYALISPNLIRMIRLSYGWKEEDCHDDAMEVV
jgi:hypothetical protein